MSWSEPAHDRALRHDVLAVLSLHRQRRDELVVPLACDVLAGEYGVASQAGLAALLVRRRWPARSLGRKPDPVAARRRLGTLGPQALADALRQVAGLGSS